MKKILSSFSIGTPATRILLLLMAIGCTAAFLLILGLRLKLVPSVNSDLGGVEQNIIYGIQLMLDGRALYPDPGDLPFYINQYTPVYYDLCYVTALIGGTGPADIHTLYIIGRMWTLIFNLLSVFAIYRISAKFFSLPMPVALTLAFSSFIFIYRQGFCTRSDSMMDCCILWTVYFFLAYLNSPSPPLGKLVLPLALAVLSFFIKQSGAIMPVILLGYLLFYGKSFRTFFIATGYTALFGFVPLIAFSLYYGQPFLKSIIGGVDNGISLLWVKNFLWGTGLKTKVLVPALICFYIVILRLRLFRGTATERFLAFSVSGLFAFNALISFKAGSNIQYFFAFTSLSFVLIVWYLFGRYYRSGGRKLVGLYHNAAGFFALGFLFALMAANTHHQYQWIREIEFDTKTSIVTNERRAAEVAAWIRENIKPKHYVFANLSNERVKLDYAGRSGINNILYDISALPANDVIDVSIVRSSVFGYEKFDRYLADGTISYVIEGSPRNKSHLPHINQLRDTHFTAVKQIGGYTIFRHNSTKD